MTLTERRRELDLSLGELARSVNLGSSVLSRIERGLENPPDQVLIDIGAKIGWSIEQVRASLPSAEDVAANQKQFENFMIAVAAAKADAKSKGYGRGSAGQGSVECPICKGSIRYRVAAVNGHMWGACSSEGCVRWME